MIGQIVPIFRVKHDTHPHSHPTDQLCLFDNITPHPTHFIRSNPLKSQVLVTPKQKESNTLRFRTLVLEKYFAFSSLILIISVPLFPRVFFVHHFCFGNVSALLLGQTNILRKLPILYVWRLTNSERSRLFLLRLPFAILSLQWNVSYLRADPKAQSYGSDTVFIRGKQFWYWDSNYRLMWYAKGKNRLGISKIWETKRQISVKSDNWCKKPFSKCEINSHFEECEFTRHRPRIVKVL